MNLKFYLKINPMLLMSLNDLRQKNFTNFIESLCLLEDNLETDEFKNSLNNLHHSFLVLQACFETRTNELSKEKIESTNINEFGISESSIASLTLKIFNEIVIDIDEKHSELASLFVGKSEDQALEKAKLFEDYDTRCCDLCGLYFRKPEFSTPTCRMQMIDFILACHSSCLEELK